MLPEYLMTYAVTIVKQANAEDRYGGQTADWSPDKVSRVTVRGFLGQSITRGEGGREDLDDRDALITAYQLFLPLDADITGHDRVEVDGEAFEVVGPPLVRRTPEGPHHIEVRLRGVSG
jgi:head-tail adaptor